LTPNIVVVFLVILAALVLFATEPVPIDITAIDITAIGIVVALMVLEPWTQVSPAQGVSGFASSATVTVLAMFILSYGVQRTDAVQILGRKIAAFTRDDQTRQLGATIGVVGAVVAVAALDALPIMVSALAGALVMVLTGVLKPPEVYDAVERDVIFLLAGVIPLGIAMEETGAADLIADLLVLSADFLPAVAVLGLFYVVTAALTNIVSNNASVVLMIPVATEVSNRLDANAFAFVLAVTFAASTAFMTPVGYQTNLFVYGPGGYKFTDYIRVGTPLQILFAVVTTAGIAAIWGV
jgi:di/tricarboxylate transporter